MARDPNRVIADAVFEATRTMMMARAAWVERQCVWAFKLTDPEQRHRLQVVVDVTGGVESVACSLPWWADAMGQPHPRANVEAIERYIADGYDGPLAW